MLGRYASFAGAACHYGHHRPGYPSQLIAGLISRVSPSGAGRLLDLGCGTGEAAFALSPYFASVVAIDPQPELVDVGRREASRIGTANITWEVTSAQAYRAAMSSFELLTIANAFHHFDRELMACRARRWLRPGCCIAILGCNSVLAGPEPWKTVLFDVVRVFQPSMVRPTGEAGWGGAGARGHGEVLDRAGFEGIDRFNCFVTHRFAMDDLVGYLHSTWFASPGALGPRLSEFDGAVRSAMSRHDTKNGLWETITFHCVVGRRPQ